MAEGRFPTVDPLSLLRGATAARVGLGRVGAALPTTPLLAFQLAQAHARDAVHASLRLSSLEAELRHPTVRVKSAACDRGTYLRNPDLGRRLSAETPRLPYGNYDLAIVLADGLSADAVNGQAADLVHRLIARLEGWSIGPIVLAEQARVAIGDPIGERLGARLIVVLIGERPGLSSPHSLGAYVTADPRPGRQDSERNCVSNIHRSGLGLDQAAEKIAWLLNAARRLGFTGNALKDRQEPGPLPALAAQAPRLSTKP